MIHRSIRKAFTLIEILIVVVILGILAAIVIPQFTKASDDAQIGNIKTQLATIRGQIELYRVRHNGAFPDLTTTAFQDIVNSGTTNAAPDGNQYLKSAPLNPRSNSAVVVAGTAAPTAAATNGWIYDAATGNIWADGFNEATGTWY